MPENQLEYRGYEIIVEPNGKAWKVSVNPKTPELPILRWNSFKAPIHSSEQAVAEARRRIDHVLRMWIA